mmetsp:Transcript_68376/g.211431  ORF Transcript_68376/g.211431 Transcript_68376/m.211431 type:complete len:202 (+) Transcript_68376:286-891(+)
MLTPCGLCGSFELLDAQATLLGLAPDGSEACLQALVGSSEAGTVLQERGETTVQLLLRLAQSGLHLLTSPALLREGGLEGLDHAIQLRDLVLEVVGAGRRLQPEQGQQVVWVAHGAPEQRHEVGQRRLRLRSRRHGLQRAALPVSGGVLRPYLPCLAWRRCISLQLRLLRPLRSELRGARSLVAEAVGGGNVLVAGAQGHS